MSNPLLGPFGELLDAFGEALGAFWELWVVFWKLFQHHPTGAARQRLVRTDRHRTQAGTVAQGELCTCGSGA